MALTKTSTDGIKDDAVTSDKVANAINSAIAANTAKTQTTINSNANNRVITGSGTANTLEGESNLTFTGSNLTITNGSGASELTVVTPNNTDGGIYFNDGSNSGALSYQHSDNSMRFRVNATEKMRINSSGQLLLGTTTANAYNNRDFTIARSAGDFYIEMRGANNSNQGLIFSQGSAADANSYQGYISYSQTDQRMGFHANSGTRRVSIDSDGLKFGSDTAAVNALSDYETGTWVPQVHDGTISYYDANYTKIGRQVTVVARITNFSNNSTNDAVRIKNLPFNAAVQDVAAGSVMYSYGGNSHYTTLYINSISGGQLNIYGGHSGAFDQLRHNELNVSSGTTDMYIIATYFAAT